jgi:hypothetical protein
MRTRPQRFPQSSGISGPQQVERKPRRLTMARGSPAWEQGKDSSLTSTEGSRSPGRPVTRQKRVEEVQARLIQLQSCCAPVVTASVDAWYFPTDGTEAWAALGPGGLNASASP